MRLSAVIAELAAAGLTGEQIAAAVKRIEDASEADLVRSSAAERQARYRQRKKEKEAEEAETITRDVTPVTPVTPSDQKKVSDKERFQTSKENNFQENIYTPREAVEAYNAVAADLNLPQVQTLTDERRKKLTARLRECGGQAGWLTALAKIRGSPFLSGENDKGWKANFDFLLQKSSFTKLMEGAYDGRSQQSGSRNQSGSPDAERRAREAAILEKYTYRGEAAAPPDERNNERKLF